MTPFDDPSNPQPPPEPEESQSPLDDLASRIVVHHDAATSDPETLKIDPASIEPTPAPPLPPDLHLPWPWPQLHLGWSWLHLFVFAVFAMGSLVVIQLLLYVQYSFGHRPDLKEFEHFLQTHPGLAVGMNVAWFLLIFAFLYISLPLFSGLSFWRTAGWTRIVPSVQAPARPWVYFVTGIGLAFLVAIASSRVKTPDNLPIQDLLKSRTGAILLMSMAVFVAPVVEETVFRGYLYPFLASSYSRIARHFGGDPNESFHVGSLVSIILTGAAFGLLHGFQLGWTRGLVAMLVAVGIVFTYTRAKAGSVVASFLMHLGYNSMIAVSTVIATHGFTRMPPHP